MSEYTERNSWLSEKSTTVQTLPPRQRENIQAALALLLGPETAYHTRLRAVRRLARQGPIILPLLLTTLSAYPEITTPAWPWWPLQYEQCGHLLVYLGKKAHIQLIDMLHHPALTQPIGPVLWISIIEAAGLFPHDDLEPLLCQGLTMPWHTVRYAASMAIGARSRYTPLQAGTLAQLRLHLDKDEALPVRLTAAYALLNSGESIGLEVLLQMMGQDVSEEVRKAATFIVATELPFPLHTTQNERLVIQLLHLLQDSNAELALHAAQALSKIAEPSLLPTLSTMLFTENMQTQIMILTALEEMAPRKNMRYTMRQQGLPSHILPLLRSPHAEIRRQAGYTLAACGGEYVTAVLGTLAHFEDHPGHLEAIESLRMLHGALKLPIRLNVMCWLVQLLEHPAEETRGTALDSLVHLLWQARTQGRRQIWRKASQGTIHTATLLQLINETEPWIRQRAVELIGLLGEDILPLHALRECLLYLLREDSDSGVRASVAYTCGQLGARWAFPALITALRDQNEHVALTALNALGQLATPDDSVIQSALAELIQERKSTGSGECDLVREAQRYLKKLRKTTAHGEAGEVA